jgi:hypothetical protein
MVWVGKKRQLQPSMKRTKGTKMTKKRRVLGPEGRQNRFRPVSPGLGRDDGSWLMVDGPKRKLGHGICRYPSDSVGFVRFPERGRRVEKLQGPTSKLQIRMGLQAGMQGPISNENGTIRRVWTRLRPRTGAPRDLGGAAAPPYRSRNDSLIGADRGKLGCRNDFIT